MIRNYESPEGTIALVDSTAVNDAKTVFTSTTNGAAYTGSNGQINAVTTIALCNTAAPTLSDENDNKVVVNIYLVRRTKTHTPGNLIVSNLIIPAGETVFFSEERLVLNEGDEIRIGTGDGLGGSGAGKLAVTVSALPV